MRLLRQLAAGCLVAILIFSPTAAMAAFDPTQHGTGDPQGGLWYLADQGVEAAHAEGYRGQGVKVAIIDSRINPAVPELIGTNLHVREPSYCVDVQGSPISAATQGAGAEHGTEMASLVVGTGAGGGPIGVAPDAEVLHYAVLLNSYDYDDAKAEFPQMQTYLVSGDRDTYTLIAAAIDQAVDDGADIISMSFSSPLSDGIGDALARAQRKGVLLVSGYANDESKVSIDRLASANGLLTVVSHDAAGSLRPFDDTNGLAKDDAIRIVAPGVDILGRVATGAGDWENTNLGTGNSYATAITSGILAVLKSKYPEATNNQLLQSILHNTTDEEHELWQDPDLRWGYGPIDLTHALSVDPTKYPDTNPLLLKGVNLRPSYADVMGENESADPNESPDPIDQPVVPSPPDDSPTIALWIGVGIGALVLLGATLAIILVVRGRRKQPSQAYPAQAWHPSNQPPERPRHGGAPGPYPATPGVQPPPHTTHHPIQTTTEAASHGNVRR